eukprot:1596811-Prymnesium_polylepis.1
MVTSGTRGLRVADDARNVALCARDIGSLGRRVGSGGCRHSSRLTSSCPTRRSRWAPQPAVPVQAWSSPGTCCSE